MVSTEALAKLQTDNTREIKSYTILTERAVAVTSEPKSAHVAPFRLGSLPIAIQVRVSQI